MSHLTARCLHSLSAASYGPYKTAEYGKLSTLWSSVDSSSGARLLIGPLQRDDGDHSHGFHSHRVLYTVGMCMVLNFAPAGQLMQMHAAAQSIPRTFELSLNGLLLLDFGLSRPLCALLQIQRDFVNSGIWDAFLCVHHFPFWHTYAIYPHNQENTWSATTPADELVQEECNIAPHCGKEVHHAVRRDFSWVPEAAPRLIRCFAQVRDTLQVCWQALAEMSLSAIWNWENPPINRVAIHPTIVQNRPCYHRCLPTLMKLMLATINKLCMRLKDPVKYNSPPWSAIFLTLPQPTRDQWGVHSPSVSKSVVTHWLVSILTTS